VSAPEQIGHLMPRTTVHLPPGGELFRQGYGGSTSVAVCGELVIKGTSSDEDPRYRPDCVREAIRWNSQPVATQGGAS
jgi:hypothetical protein